MPTDKPSNNEDEIQNRSNICDERAMLAVSTSSTEQHHSVGVNRNSNNKQINRPTYSSFAATKSTTNTSSSDDDMIDFKQQTLTSLPAPTTPCDQRG